MTAYDCIIEPEEGERFFRRIAATTEKGLCNLSFLNPLQQSDPILFNIGSSLIAKVCWIRKLIT